MDLKEQALNPHRHPWELSRADMALGLLSPNGNPKRYADIGSGDLYFARRLTELNADRVYAVDIHYAVQQNENRLIVCTDLHQVPSRSVDCAILMDVLEHVKDDVGLLRDVTRILTDAGELLITVPAHAFLWSEHDVFLGHFRRYTRAMLHDAVRRGGFHATETFYFYAIPWVASAMTVGLAKVGVARTHAGAVGRWPFSLNHPLTKTLRRVLNADFRASRALGTGPLAGCGLSIAMRCRRTSA